MRRASAYGLAAALLLPPALDAQSKRPPAAIEAEHQRVVRRWHEGLRDIDRMLVDDQAKKAYGRVTRLLDEMTKTMVAGPGVPVLLSTALVLRAIAAVQLGESDEGIWHWQVAQQLFPEVASYKMNAYGDAGELLKAHPAPEPPARGEPAEDETAPEKHLEPPKKLVTPSPEFPWAKRGIDAVAIVVEVTIGTDGRVRQPRIVESKGELTLVSETLDTLRLWQFEPARLDGEPVAVLYNLTVNFRTPPMYREPD